VLFLSIEAEKHLSSANSRFHDSQNFKSNEIETALVYMKCSIQISFFCRWCVFCYNQWRNWRGQGLRRPLWQAKCKKRSLC